MHLAFAVDLDLVRFAAASCVFLLCSLVVMNFHGKIRLSARVAPLLLSVEKPIRTFAVVTFALCLLHQPLFLSWGAVIRVNPDRLFYWASVAVATAASVALISYVTERRCHTFKLVVKRCLERCCALA